MLTGTLKIVTSHYVWWGSKFRNACCNSRSNKCPWSTMSNALLMSSNAFPYPVLRSWFSGTLNNAFKSDRGAPFYFLYGGKWCTVGWDIVPYLVYSVHWRAYAAIVGSWHRFSLERTVCWLWMILLHLPHQLIHLEGCWRSAPSLLLKGIWYSIPCS